jgi:hypothetical protein
MGRIAMFCTLLAIVLLTWVALHITGCGGTQTYASPPDMACDGGQCCALRVLAAADGGQVLEDRLPTPATVCEVVCLAGSVWGCCPEVVRMPGACR